MDSQLVNNSNRAVISTIKQISSPSPKYPSSSFSPRRTPSYLSSLDQAIDMRKSTTFTAGPDDIIGAQTETSGLAALGALCGIVLTSLRPVRKWFWDFFWVVHVLGFVVFFITINYHTIYATLGIKDATLTASDINMTSIRVQDCDTNWIAGQHVRLRVFFSGRVTFPSESGRGIILGARVAGDWTRALNDYADVEGKAVLAQNAMWVAEKKKKAISNDDQSSLSDQPAVLAEVPVQVMLDGPYGGCSLDLGHYETVLLIAGGSGATFTIGVLDDIVGHCARLGQPNNERTRRIEFIWCLRSYPGINWFTSLILSIANVVADCPDLDLQISVYVTCLCNPEAVPSILNSDVLVLAQRLGYVEDSVGSDDAAGEEGRMLFCG
ncbi:hypothetical protein C8R42DRAFT_781060 [Lentinula raphanica]|nr:hypothetical protein C8R42DRAFT_781060 [Lentinula raphanica]